MLKWRCRICGYIYDEKTGEPATNTKPETLFKDLAVEWKCPVCGAEKSEFSEISSAEKISGDSATTVSDAIVSELLKWDINVVFGLPGTSSLGIVEAIRKNKNIKYIVVRHEENAAMAASAYNKFTGKIAACLTIAGPGATNLATGLYDAKEDNSSVISINGQVRAQYTGPGGIQEIDQDAFFRPLVVYNNTIYDKHMALLLLTKALKFSIIQKGVSQISVPNNIQKEFIDIEKCKKENITGNYEVSPDSSVLKLAADLIDKAKNPVIIIGWGCRDCRDEILKLSNKIKAPIVTTFRAKGIISDYNEWNLGILGSVGTPHAREFVNNSDLLITAGVGFSQLTNVPTDRKIIQIDSNPLKLEKSSEGISLLGNCSLIIPGLLELANEKQNNKILTEIKNLKQIWEEILLKEADENKTPIRPPFIMKVLSDVIPENSAIGLDVGENQWWFGRNFRIKNQKFAMSGYLGTMGFGFPAALAAKIAWPEKDVFCITGDGGFSMAMADFVTAVKYNLAIVVVVLSNRELGMIQVEQMMENYENYATDLLNPDFAEYAKNCGGDGIRVEKPDELKPALIKAMKSKKPFIVDINTDPKRFAE
ncbi:thiamine pyrophosphate-dependent enzyme [Methanomicrobium antiquum]|uniref:Thiamine pyrophosphate-dependent enzyme n=1 Tax=Methanomicrobium antiquum TaxID=487686 RepID=A0AAF0JMB3_9EURY|nr:thiamine pyrophosphate-dependent enzyme [Methanomicrobium antiquum]MDD3977589.1 thiamine pyrophosphate-binding protein [Methanomicrobium sp.]WFN37659.1 thiamine pyrophosphate-dependent enzyme [Methanomicrobium antiquum]